MKRRTFLKLTGATAIVAVSSSLIAAVVSTRDQYGVSSLLRSKPDLEAFNKWLRAKLDAEWQAAIDKNVLHGSGATPPEVDINSVLILDKHLERCTGVYDVLYPGMVT